MTIPAGAEMTTAEHYAEAERLITEAEYHEKTYGDDSDLYILRVTAVAQVHATLATVEPR